MSWLYTIVFAGLMFSSNANNGSTTEHWFQNGPAAVEIHKQDETERFEQIYPLNAHGRVNISNVNGSITVEAWDRVEVKLEYVKTADSKERLPEVEVRIESKPEYFSVETNYDKWRTTSGSDRWKNHGSFQVNYHLTVPRGAVLNEIETVNGSVTVSNFVNITRVSAVNGSVNATNICGTAKLSTVNGEVIADFDRLENGSKISLETVNGRVNLVIPSDANATVKADSLNGNITNDFGLPVRKGKYVGRDLYGRLGSGDVQIRLNSVNGGLAIGRKDDGKNPNPAVNLLPQKEKDDEDWDKDDEDISFNSAKMDKDVAKAVKAAAKVSSTVAVKAMADAQDQINKIQPELAKITTESVTRAVEVMKSDEFKQQIKQAMTAKNEVFAKMAEANFYPSVPRVEKKSQSFPVKGIPKVTIDAKGCSVTVRGWDKPEVSFSLVKIRRDNQKVQERDSSVSVKNTDSEVIIKVTEEITSGGIIFNDGKKVRLEVYVPKKSNLKISANGEIRLDGVSGDVELAGSDQSINVRDVDGTLRVSNTDGRIRVIGFRGQIEAQTSDGTISLEGDFNKLKARSSAGEIFLTLPENTQADIEANCAELRGEGIALTRTGGNGKLSKYRVGNGGALFQIETDGEIHVRGAAALSDSF
ncbi:MAG: DUF4097 family beta strand repeat-containing protein [Pyrinomonadaceae bacterium]